MEMTQTGAGIEDIFKGAEKVEILGKLPSFLWAYIEAARKLVQQVQTNPAEYGNSAKNVEKLLGVLN
jgi:hypothetical protein